MSNGEKIDIGVFLRTSKVCTDCLQAFLISEMEHGVAFSPIVDTADQ